MTVLVAFCRELDAALSPTHRELVGAREAERLGLGTAAWSAIRGATANVELLRIIHRELSGERSHVRVSGPDGAWSVAAARAGQLRSRPQSFRVDDHIEAAWDHATLRARLAALLLVSESRAVDPVGEAAQLVWALTRAQPFAGANERVALIVAARHLRAGGLPAFDIVAVERDPGFVSALATAAADDHSTLEHYLTAVVWSEALALVEWLGAPPPSAGAPWTLRDQHLALEALRGNPRQIAREDLDRFLGVLARAVPDVLSRRDLALDPHEARSHDTFPDRLRASLDAAIRGHLVSPHAPLADVRWRLHTTTGLHVIAVVGAAGRGISGAASLHLAMEITGVPNPRMAPALLLLPGEPEAAREDRLVTWLDGAVARIVADSPLRI